MANQLAARQTSEIHKLNSPFLQTTILSPISQTPMAEFTTHFPADLLLLNGGGGGGDMFFHGDPFFFLPPPDPQFSLETLIPPPQLMFSDSSSDQKVVPPMKEEERTSITAASSCGDYSNEITKNRGSPNICSRRGKRARNYEEEGDVVHVRARRGQATDKHSLAERVRRSKINEKLKYLRDIVPGCYKTMGMSVMLDETINYVQSLQSQVEFLSMKLTEASTFYDFDSEPDLANIPYVG